MPEKLIVPHLGLLTVVDTGNRTEVRAESPSWVSDRVKRQERRR